MAMLIRIIVNANVFKMMLRIPMRSEAQQQDNGITIPACVHTLHIRYIAHAYVSLASKPGP